MAPPEETWFEQLFNAEYKRMLRFACRIAQSREMAEDVVAETFEFVIKNEERIKQLENPPAYLYKVMKYKMFNELKKARYKYEISEPKPEAVLPFRDKFIYTNKVSFRSTLPNILTEEEKDLLVMRFEMQLSSQEIADVLKANPGACRERLRRTIKKLRENYSETNKSQADSLVKTANVIKLEKNIANDMTESSLDER